MTEKIVQISLPSDVLAVVQAEADYEHMTLSEIIEGALEFWFKERGYVKRKGSYVPKQVRAGSS